MGSGENYLNNGVPTIPVYTAQHVVGWFVLLVNYPLPGTLEKIYLHM